MRPLIVAYSFPPKGGPGVQRNLKFVKYLERLGHRPSVLTVKRLAQTVEDPLLLSQVPEGTVVSRAGSLDPARIMTIVRSARHSLSRSTDAAKRAGSVSETSAAYKLHKWLQRWVLLPDAGVLWAPFAIPKGVRHVRQEGVDVIVGSCPGPSSLVIALIIGKLTSKPVVFDYRDGWRDYPYREFATPWHEKLDARLESMVIPRADHHIVFGSFLSDRLGERYSLDPSTFSVIPNGFDPEDFENLEPWQHSGHKRRIVHSGNLMGFRLDPFRTFVAGLARLPSDVQDSIVVDLVGNCHPDVQSIIAEHDLSGIFSEWGYRSHNEALQLLAAADASLILLPAHDTAAFTGKIFEYLAVGKPILGLANPVSGCGQILSSLGDGGALVDPDNPEEVTSAILSFVANGWPSLGGDGAVQYSRRTQADAFALELSKVIDDFTRNRT